MHVRFHCVHGSLGEFTEYECGVCMVVVFFFSMDVQHYIHDHECESSRERVARCADDALCFPVGARACGLRGTITCRVVVLCIVLFVFVCFIQSRCVCFLC